MLLPRPWTGDHWHLSLRPNSRAWLAKEDKFPPLQKGRQSSVTSHPSLRWVRRSLDGEIVNLRKKCPSSTGSPSKLVKAQQSNHPGREGEEKIMGSHSSEILAANVYWSMTVCQSLFCVLTVINPYNMPGKEAWWLFSPSGEDCETWGGWPTRTIGSATTWDHLLPDRRGRGAEETQTLEFGWSSLKFLTSGWSDGGKIP